MGIANRLQVAGGIEGAARASDTSVASLDWPVAPSTDWCQYQGLLNCGTATAQAIVGLVKYGSEHASHSSHHTTVFLFVGDGCPNMPMHV